MKKKWTHVFLSLFVSLILSMTAVYRTDGFLEEKIEGVVKDKQNYSAQESIHPILSQTFRYLSKGRQSFVFESEDGQYVLKFFNRDYFEMPWYGFFVHEKEKRKRDLRRSFFENSYEIAFQELGEEILYLHMAKSQNLPPIKIKTKDKRMSLIDSNQVAFVLQTKGEPFYPTLQKIYQLGGEEALSLEIEKFVKQIHVRIEKGIADADSDVKNNWGYVKGRIFHLDPGRLYYDPELNDPHRKEQEVERSTRSLKKWLQRQGIYPAPCPSAGGSRPDPKIQMIGINLISINSFFC